MVLKYLLVPSSSMESHESRDTGQVSRAMIFIAALKQKMIDAELREEDTPKK